MILITYKCLALCTIALFSSAKLFFFFLFLFFQNLGADGMGVAISYGLLRTLRM